MGFFSANIDLYKLKNKTLIKVFNELSVQLPSESTVRRPVKKFVDNHLHDTKNNLKNYEVFLIIDEIQIFNRKLVNALVEKISNHFEIHLIKCTELAKNSNYEFISQIIVDLTIEFDIKREKLLVTIGDAASYMKKLMVVLGPLFPNIRHLTCIAHLFYNCAMQIKSFYKDVDHLISSIKSLTFKNNTRKQMFISIPTLPHSVVTRWGLD
ncbi:hypothetical protein CDIK_1568 [Cucumispora dikerogammari]|nr:hypothetical protein CDIK_1568 [Cucumispora dikerogammari]